MMVAGLALAMSAPMGAIAQETAAGQPEADRTQAELAESVSAAVSVMLRFRDHPDLTGEYRVNADTTVSVPVVGRVPVADVTPAELEEILASKVAEITGSPSFVTVEHSGASPWQPGMTVLQALAVSGGIARLMPAGIMGQGADPGRLAKALDDKARLLAALARVRAELAGEETVEPPPDLEAIAGPEQAERLIASQNAVLESRRGSVAAELAALERGKTLAADELEGLQTQAESIEHQLELRRQNAERIEDLRKRGLAVADKSLEQELKVLELEEKTTNISVALARVRTAIAGLERDEVTLRERRSAELGQELLRLERELAQVSLEADAAVLMGAPHPSSVGLGGPAPEPRYRITRKDADGGTVILDAEENTAMWPGDVLVVSLEPAAARSAQEARSRP